MLRMICKLTLSITRLGCCTVNLRTKDAFKFTIVQRYGDKTYISGGTVGRASDYLSVSR